METNLKFIHLKRHRFFYKLEILRSNIYCLILYLRFLWFVYTLKAEIKSGF